jgi:hypothetical protein
MKNLGRLVAFASLFSLSASASVHGGGNPPPATGRGLAFSASVAVLDNSVRVPTAKMKVTSEMLVISGPE